ncbi:hypothetical protein HYY75_01000, partial [bacterium]|nr:hypothetical protein [bacterium]
MKKSLKTYPMAQRHNLVHLKDFGRLPEGGFSASKFVDSIPNIHAGVTLRKVIDSLIQARKSNRPVLLGMGAHVIKCGVSPYLIKLMESSALTGIAMNGAAAIHDFELAYFGETSEDVAKELKEGRFGCVEETGAWMSETIDKGAKANLGLGKCLVMEIDS